MGDRLVTHKLVNALVPTAQPGAAMQEMLDSVTFGFRNPALDWLRSKMRGLWVGGDLYIFEDRLKFEPNALNRAAHAGDVSVEIRLSDVSAVRWRPGVLTSIVDVQHHTSTTSFRCFGSKALAADIERTRAGLVGQYAAAS
jgi:hypothetical protein